MDIFHSLPGSKFGYVAIIISVIALILAFKRKFKSNFEFSSIAQVILGLFGLGLLTVGSASCRSERLGPSPEPTPILSESINHTLVIPANIYWVKTGVLINTGQHITIQATGIVNTMGGTAQSNSDPNGNLKLDICLEDTCALKNFDYGALVGRIGEGNPFRIGVYIEMVAESSGELELTVNDEKDYYYDNFGEFQVSLYIW